MEYEDIHENGGLTIEALSLSPIERQTFGAFPDALESALPHRFDIVELN